jgi:hypothetical protein
MKRLLLLLGVLCALCVSIAEPPPPRAVAAVPGNTMAAALIYRGDFQPIVVVVGEAITPQSKAGALLKAFAQAKPGDLIMVGFGLYDFGKDAHVILPDGVTIRGMGRDQTILLSSVVSDDKGTSFALQNTVVEDCTLKNDCWNPGEDGRCVGFDNGQFGVGPGPFTAELHRCRCWCRDWTVYCWSPYNALSIEDCEIVTGRVGVAAENSGDGSNFDVMRTHIIGDASLSKSQGATSKHKNGGCFGAVCRGGRTRFIDCSMDLKGQPLAPQDAAGSWTPRICGIVDRGGAGDAPATVTNIEVYNLRCHIDPNGADPNLCFDLNLEFDYVQKLLRCNFPNCWGSAANGSLSTSYQLSP